MDWIEITPAQAKTLLSEYEWEAVTNAARASSAGDVVALAVARVVRKVRGYVETNPANTLGPEGYIPAVLEDCTLVLIMDALATSLPGAGIILDEARRQRITGAMGELKMVAKGDLKISGPGSGQTVPDDAPAADAGGYGGDAGINFGGIR